MMARQAFLPLFEGPLVQSPLFVLPPQPKERTDRFSFRLTLMREFIGCAVEAGYLWDDVRTLDLVPRLAALRYDDALACNAWRLELLYLTTGYPHYRLFYRGKVWGVADIHAEWGDIAGSRKAPQVRLMMAAYLVCLGWNMYKVTPLRAKTKLNANVKYQYRLFKPSRLTRASEAQYDYLED